MKRLSIMISLLAVNLVIVQSRKVLDVVFVLDMVPLEGEKIQTACCPDGSTECCPYQVACVTIVHDISKQFLETHQKEVDVQISLYAIGDGEPEELVSTKEGINVNAFETKLKQFLIGPSGKPFKDGDAQSYWQRPPVIFKKVRDTLASKADNRDTPDLLVWIILSQTASDPVMNNLRVQPNGPLVVIAVAITGTVRPHYRVVFEEPDNPTQKYGFKYGDDVTGSKVFELIMWLHNKCGTAESVDDECYFINDAQACKKRRFFHHQPKIFKFSRNCVASTTESDCGKDTCEENCKNAEHETGQCSTTCGDGVQSVQPKGENFRFCDTTDQECNGPPCPGAAPKPTPDPGPGPRPSQATRMQTTRKRKPTKGGRPLWETTIGEPEKSPPTESTQPETSSAPFQLETWHIAVIVVGLATLLVVVGGITACCVFRKRRRASQFQDHRGLPSQHYHPPPRDRRPSQRRHGSSAGKPWSVRTYDRSEVDRRRPRSARTDERTDVDRTRPPSRDSRVAPRPAYLNVSHVPGSLNPHYLKVSAIPRSLKSTPPAENRRPSESSAASTSTSCRPKRGSGPPSTDQRTPGGSMSRGRSPPRRR